MKLQNIALREGDYRTRHYSGDAPISYLFVETVVESGLLREAAAGRLAQLMKTAITKLQNFMTPGAASDLDALLGFINPAGGGIPKIKQMVKKAGESATPILDDQTWWQDMFNIFGVKDESLKQSIIYNSKKSAGAAPVDYAPNSTPGGGGKPQPPAPAPPQATAPAAVPQTPLNGQIDAFKAKLAARGQELQSRAAKPRLTPAAPAVEGLWDELAAHLMTETAIKSNLRFVANNMLRKLGHTATVNVQSDDWFKDFMARRPVVREGFADFFRDLRTKAANPGYADVRASNSQMAAYNERAAKLAVRFLSDYLTAEMENRLKVANLSADDMMRTSKEWQKIQMAYGKNPTASSDSAFMAKYQDAYQKMQRLLFALNPDLARQSGSQM